MASTIAWLDHSEGQRRRMMEVVGLFGEKGTVDDLGLGVVRDSLSELLFPGTSTLHTRAAYLLFVPWVYRDLEHRKAPSATVAKRARSAEVQLIGALLDGGETDGLIGQFAGQRLVQLPSQAYWGALGRYRIRRFEGPREQYHRSLDGFYRGSRRTVVSDDGEPITGAAPNWDPELPPVRDGLLASTTFALSGEEAGYLRDRIRTAAPRSFLAHLLSGSADRASVDAPWEHPALATAPEQRRAEVAHARRFSEVVHGAQLRYNLLLAERVADLRSRGAEGLRAGDDLVDHYRERLAAWRDRIDAAWADYAAWDLDAFWATVLRVNPRLSSAARAFVAWWIRRVLDDPDGLDSDDVRDAIARRERSLKGGLARLSNDRALERWGGAAAAEPLVFRWASVSRLVDDVLDGVEGA